MAAQSRWYSIGSWPRIAGREGRLDDGPRRRRRVPGLAPAARGRRRSCTSTSSDAAPVDELARVALRLGQPALHEIEPDRGDLHGPHARRTLFECQARAALRARRIAEPLEERVAASHAWERSARRPGRDGRPRPNAATPPLRTQEGTHEGPGSRNPGRHDPSRRHGGQHPPRAGAPRPPRDREPAPHQDAQDPRDRPDADGGGRDRDHLPEARRGRGVRRSRRRRRRPPHLQHPRPRED